MARHEHGQGDRERDVAAPRKGENEASRSENDSGTPEKSTRALNAGTSQIEEEWDCHGEVERQHIRVAQRGSDAKSINPVPDQILSYPPEAYDDRDEPQNGDVAANPRHIPADGLGSQEVERECTRTEVKHPQEISPYAGVQERPEDSPQDERANILVGRGPPKREAAMEHVPNQPDNSNEPNE